MCQIECHKLRSYDRCGCIPHFYAKSNYPFCQLDEMRCIQENYDKIIQEHCDCPGNCHSFDYDVFTTVDTNQEQVLIYKMGVVVGEELINPDFEKLPMTIDFYTWPMIRYKTEVVYGWVDLLVSFGGIAGLFLGLSVLSIFEIFYFFTLRFLGEREEIEVVDVQKVANKSNPHNRVFMISRKHRFETQKIGVKEPEFIGYLP